MTSVCPGPGLHAAGQRGPVTPPLAAPRNNAACRLTGPPGMLDLTDDVLFGRVWAAVTELDTTTEG
jgi:hypothetical protein